MRKAGFTGYIPLIVICRYQLLKVVPETLEQVRHVHALAEIEPEVSFNTQSLLHC